MGVNFTHCYEKYQQITKKNDTRLWNKYAYTGPLIDLARNNTSQISRNGCRELCGTGAEYYSWDVVSNTLTTWILPVIGTLLQAPFESNATKKTLLALARWIGSPVASIAYVLWNIKVSAKAALMVDMAVEYDETPDCKKDFGSMRDSMYLLLVMNQYALNSDAVQHKKKGAECLLRIALFSRDLGLTDPNISLRDMRRNLARELREMRRRGAVPVFVSTLWFLFAFALSVEGAFNQLGKNTTAHDLALGCLLAWFPILIMASIVDRNPIAAEAIRKKLNALIDHVRNALRDEQHRKHYIDTFRGHPEFEDLRARVDNIGNAEENSYDFFEEFAGQARVRWHYGAAHPILCDIEGCYIARKGRNWLADEKDARFNLVLGKINDEGLMWFDIREFWQVASAILIVAGSCGGAFIISFFTPTVGLGCRSGGYTIFFSIALGLIIVEMAVWLVTSPYKMDIRWLNWVMKHLRAFTAFKNLENTNQKHWEKLKPIASSFFMRSVTRFIDIIVWLRLLAPTKNKKARKVRVTENLKSKLKKIRDMSVQKKWETFFFRPIEAFNTVWLIYIVLAQTFGWYETCDCKTSIWGNQGGYLDFQAEDQAPTEQVLYYWASGTCLAGAVLLFSMFYITVEWCQQSFISTEDYDDAMTGLLRTRAYRSWTFVFRAAFRFISRFTFDPLETVAMNIGLVGSPQETLVWTREHTHEPSPASSQPQRPTRQNASPSIQLTMPPDSTLRHDDSALHDIPDMAHSLRSPAVTTRPSGNESNASFTESILPIYRTSHDSHRPPVQRPSD
ncbi:hypothetical protein ACEQ8H_007024 [Pleosporales sp. CAS-2024a]